MPIREMTVVDGKAVFADEVLERETFGPGSKLVVDYYGVGWYRNFDGLMAYMWTSDYAPRSVIEALIDKGMSGEWRYTQNNLGLEEFVPDPQDQPGVPQGNDWLSPRQKRDFLARRQRYR